MADQGHPPRYSRTEYSQDDYTLQSTVRDLYYSELSFNPLGPFILKDILCAQYDQVSLISSFNEPIIPDSTLTTPVSQNMDFTLNVHKFPPPSSQWGQKSGPVTYTNFVQRDQRMYEPPQNPRMKSNSKDSILAVETAPHLSEQPEFGLTISSPGYMNSFDSPSNAGSPSPYFQPYNVSGAPPSTPQPLTHSNPYSTPTSQLAPSITPVWSQYPPTSQHCHVQTTAPTLMQLSPPFLRNQKRILEEPVKHENQPMHSQQRLGLMHHDTSRNNFSHQRTRKSESPPTQHEQVKRRKPSGLGPTPIYDPDYRSQSVGGTLPSRPQQVQARHAFTSSQYAERSVLSDNERLLLDLRSHEPQLDWKKTAFEYSKITGQDKKVPALQMQCTRAKEKLRVWHKKDQSAHYYESQSPHHQETTWLVENPERHGITALREAKKFDEAGKWKRIADLMTSSNVKVPCDERWTPRACQLKHAELEPNEVDEAPKEMSPGRDDFEELQAPLPRNNSYPSLSYGPPPFQYSNNF